VGFRQDKKKRLEHSRWLKLNRENLLSCGIPCVAYGNEQEWTYFLNHGTQSAPTRPHWFNVKSLSSEQQRKLLDFLSSQYPPDRTQPAIVKELKTLLSNASSPTA
jgi:hypothetical protein